MNRTELEAVCTALAASGDARARTTLDLLGDHIRCLSRERHLLDRVAQLERLLAEKNAMIRHLSVPLAERIALLSDTDRVTMFGPYCTCCGTPDPFCCCRSTPPPVG